jgi:hypothetical protein
MAGRRPEDLLAAVGGDTGPAPAGDVGQVQALGAELVVHVTTNVRRIRAECGRLRHRGRHHNDTLCAVFCAEDSGLRSVHTGGGERELDRVFS